MTSTDPNEYEDQDAEPASEPTGAAAVDAPEDQDGETDQDAGPASVPDPS